MDNELREKYYEILSEHLIQWKAGKNVNVRKHHLRHLAAMSMMMVHGEVF